MPKKIEIRFKENTTRVMARGVGLEDLMEAVETLNQAIEYVKNKKDENQKHAQLQPERKSGSKIHNAVTDNT